MVKEKKNDEWKYFNWFRMRWGPPTFALVSDGPSWMVVLETTLSLAEDSTEPRLFEAVQTKDPSECAEDMGKIISVPEGWLI